MFSLKFTIVVTSFSRDLILMYLFNEKEFFIQILRDVKQVSSKYLPPLFVVCDLHEDIDIITRMVRENFIPQKTNMKVPSILITTLNNQDTR